VTIVALPLLSSIFTPPVGDFDFYVDPAAGGGGNGSLASPWNSLSQVTNATLSPGQSVGLKGGATFTGQLMLTESGAAGSPITIGSYGTGQAILTSQTLGSGPIYLNGSDYVVVDNIRIDQTSGVNGDRKGIYLRNGANNCIIRNCYITRTPAAIFSEDSNNGLIQNCQMIDNNRMIQDINNVSDYGAFAVFLHNCDDWIIDSNEMAGGHSDSVFFGKDGSAVELFAGCARTIITRNKITNCMASVEEGGSANVDTVVAYNDIHGGTTGDCQLVAQVSGSTLKFYHNTHVLTGGQDFPNQKYLAYMSVSNGATVDLKNNIFVRSPVAASQFFGTAVTSNYNIFPASQSTPFTKGANDIQTASPGLVSTSDSHLAAGSPAINSGTTVIPSFTEDHEGNPIVGSRDRGCYEYQGVTDPITNVLWTGDHSEGSLADWYSPSTTSDGNEGGDPLQFSGGGNTTVSTTVARSGTHSLRHHTTNGAGSQQGCRAFRWRELWLNRELYLECWYYIPEVYTLTGDPATGQFWSAMQIKAQRIEDTPDYNYPMWSLEFRNPSAGVLRPMMTWGAGGNPTAGPFSTSNVSFKSWGTKYINGNTTGFPPVCPIAQWFRVRMWIRQSNAFDGRLVMWLNDEMMYDFRNIRTGVQTNRHGNSWQVDNQWSCNLYHDGTSPAPAFLYLDDARIGTGPAPAT
jgi:parallel beta-helix repeat protein